MKSLSLYERSKMENIMLDNSFFNLIQKKIFNMN